jgi:hypothetical protein
MKKLLFLACATVLAAVTSMAMAQPSPAPVSGVKSGYSIGPTAHKTPAIKDLNAARDLEISRAKFNVQQSQMLETCVQAVKTAEALTGCQTAYRDAMAANTLKLIQDGRFAQAYDLPQATPALPASASSAVAEKK